MLSMSTQPHPSHSNTLGHRFRVLNLKFETEENINKKQRNCEDHLIVLQEKQEAI